ncbi:DegV family protein [Lentilactobacillus kefiri]|uniref:DegV family protein n=1 Tax=Lentilactobacillus kefiri TaxID=33962 RepID=UPI00345EF133
MSKIKIVTDSAAHVANADIRAYNIYVLNPPILIDGRVFGYVNKISSEKFLQLFDSGKNKPVIGDISVADLTETYNKLGEDGSQILSIHLSDKMSSSYNNAKTAASKSTTDVTVLNSQVTAAGLAYQVLKAAKMIKEGKIIKDILPELAKVRDNTRIFSQSATTSKSSTTGLSPSCRVSLASMQIQLTCWLSKVTTFVWWRMDPRTSP